MGVFAGIKVPVISAPMAGGVNNPAMVSAVINAGGVGSFGFAYTSPKKIEEDLIQTLKLCHESSPPINANFFVFKNISPPSEQQVKEALVNLRQLSHISISEFPEIKEPFFPNLEEQLEPVWKLKPKFLTFHFGIPHEKIIEKAKALGISIGITATNEREALQIQEGGADFVIAQGIEAGGHRGIFDVEGFDEKLTAIELLHKLKKVIDIPIVIAGGVMTPSDVRSVIDAGADMVQMGTAFLTTKESSASPAHKRFLLTDNARGTAYTKAFSGRWAQGINNRFIEAMAGKYTLPFPLQNTMTSSIRQEALRLDDGEFQSLWCGSRYTLCKEISINDLMLSIEQELLS